MQFRNLTALILISSLTTACGGGGDDTSLTIPSTPVAITASNSEKISADSYAISDTASDLNFIAVNSEFDPNINSIAQLIKSKISNQANNSVVSAASYACTDGGSISFPDVINEDDFSDITITLSSCNEGGNIFNGDLTLSFNFNLDTMSITGNRLKITQGSQGIELLDYSFVMNGLTSDTYSIALDYTLNSTELNGQVTVRTTTPFEGNFSENPYAGELIITGENGSKARVTAVSDRIHVTIDLDADGDDDYETTTTKTWTELEAL